MNVVREARPARELKVLHGGTGLTARAVGKTYKGRPALVNATWQLAS